MVNDRIKRQGAESAPLDPGEWEDLPFSVKQGGQIPLELLQKHATARAHAESFRSLPIGKQVHPLSYAEGESLPLEKAVTDAVQKNNKRRSR